jgi:hypothetical protein
MTILVLTQEALPLRDPRDGWRVNYGFWMRVGILAGVVSCTLSIQANFMARTPAITSRKLGLLFICQSLSYPSVSMGIAALVGFPIPFFALSTIPIFFVLHVVWFTVLFGQKVVRGMFSRKEEMTTYAQFICAQMLMPAVYPLYEVAFFAASNTYYELPVILLLPIIKIVMKYIVTLSLVRREDMMPEAVIFTVEFFHAVYLATCMQRTSSTVTVAIIIVVDVSQSVAMLVGLHRRSRTTLARAHRAAGVTCGNESLISALRIVCTSLEEVEKQNLDDIQVFSCFPHPLSESNKDLLGCVEKLQQRKHTSRSSARSFLSDNGAALVRVVPTKHHVHFCQLCVSICRRNAVKPFIPGLTIPSASVGRSVVRRSSRQNSLVSVRSKILGEGLEALFTCECLVLVAYLHTSIAMFYVSYIVVMVFLPSAQYHTELHGVTHENVAASVQSVIVFGILELVSFGLLAAMIKLKYGVVAFYHLAFVLETQVELIQGKVMMWMLIILAFRVVHFGTS